MTIVTAVQMESSDDIEQNLVEAIRLLDIAATEQNSNLVVFPENFLCFAKTQQRHLANNISFYLSKFQAIAADQSINLVLGSIPSLIREDGKPTDGRFRSASYVINSQGDICCQYDKINLFDVDVKDEHGQYRESETFEAGSSIKVTDIQNLKLGLSICYDLRFAELYIELRKRGAQIITVPAAFTKTTGDAHWQSLLRARAIETQCAIVAANQGGI